MEGPQQGKGLRMSGINAATGVHASLNMAAQVQAQGTVTRTSQALSSAAGAAIKAASNVSQFVDVYA
jgi:hypothetical protein